MAEFGKKVELTDVVAKYKTPRALICEIDGEEFVVPDSQIDDDSDVYAQGDKGTLIVNEWWAIQAGLV